MSVTWESVYYGTGLIGSGYILRKTYMLPAVSSYIGYLDLHLTPECQKHRAICRAIGVTSLFTVPLLISGYGVVYFSRKLFGEWKKRNDN